MVRNSYQRRVESGRRFGSAERNVRLRCGRCGVERRRVVDGVCRRQRPRRREGMKETSSAGGGRTWAGGAARSAVVHGGRLRGFGAHRWRQSDSDSGRRRGQRRHGAAGGGVDAGSSGGTLSWPRSRAVSSAAVDRPLQHNNKQLPNTPAPTTGAHPDNS